MFSFNKKLKAFTLTELLIGISILGVIGAVLFSVAGGSTEKSKRISARDSLIELGKSLESYQRDSGTLPAPTTTDGVTPQSIDFVGFLTSKSSLASYVGKYKTDPNGIVLINNEPVFYTRDAAGRFYVIGVNTVNLDGITFNFIPTANAAGKEFITETNYSGIDAGNKILSNSGEEMSFVNTNPTGVGFRIIALSSNKSLVTLTKTGTIVPSFTLTKSDATTEALTVANIDGSTATAGQLNYLITSPSSSLLVDSVVSSSELAFTNYVAPSKDGEIVAMAADLGGGGGGGAPAPTGGQKFLVWTSTNIYKTEDSFATMTSSPKTVTNGGSLDYITGVSTFDGTNIIVAGSDNSDGSYNIYKSTDGGNTFLKLSGATTGLNRADRIIYGADVNTIIAFDAGDSQIKVSTNGGTSFSPYSSTLQIGKNNGSNDIHAGYFGINVSSITYPRFPVKSGTNIYIAGSDDGSNVDSVYKSTNGGVSFTKVSTTFNGNFYNLSVVGPDVLAAQVYLQGYGNVSMLSTDGGVTWNPIGGPSGEETIAF